MFSFQFYFTLHLYPLIRRSQREFRQGHGSNTVLFQKKTFEKEEEKNPTPVWFPQLEPLRLTPPALLQETIPMTMAVDPAPVVARPSARAFPSSVPTREERLPSSGDSHTSSEHTGEEDCEVHRFLPYHEASPSGWRVEWRKKTETTLESSSREGVKCSWNL